MSLIPFILDLADELHEFSRCLASGIDINDFGFGLYTGTNDQQQQQPTSPQQQQQQQQQQSSTQQQSPRRSRTSSFSSTFWMPTKRHHPYSRIKSACCGKPLGDEGGTVSIGVGISGVGGEKDVSPTGTPGKAASYSVVNKNGFQVSMNVKQFSPNELSVKTIDNCIVVEGRHDDKEDGHGVISRHFVRKYMLPKGYDPKDVLSTLSSDGILTVKAPPPPPPIAKNDERTERIVEIQPAPGPAQTVPVVVSAKEAPLKEQTKKLLSPAAKAEYHMPEKRQKLDLHQDQEQETIVAQTPPSPPAQPPTSSSESSAAVAVAAPVAAAEEEENEKAEEKTAESNNKQPPQEKADDSAIVTAAAAPAADVDGNGNGDDDVKEDAKPEVAAQADDKQLKQKVAMEIDETDKTLEDKLPETNGDTNAPASNESSTEPNEPVAESCTTSATKKTTDAEVPAENAKKDEVTDSKAADNDSKMEVDEDVVDTVVNNTETADVEKNAKAKAATEEEKGEDNNAATENTNNNTTTNSTTQNDKGKNDDDNTTAGKVPADSAKSAVTTKAAESVADGGDNDMETAVVPPETKIEIDDVALLKAAVTADATEITAAEENALLSEPMDGIATSDSPSSVVDKVECSLFAKSHLGNGNSATTLVATEEVAN